jgi:Holliday junction DNA helicase RuvA
MIVAIEGLVSYKDATKIHISLDIGITYGVFISQNTLLNIKTNKIKLFIKEIIKEDSYTMYGFYENSEKELFEQLIKLSGIGAKVAIGVCSTYTPKEFINIIYTRDINALKKVSGIGAKVASRIMVELANVVIQTNDSASSKYINDAKDALANLGFTKSKIDKAIGKCKSNDTASLVKEALKIL